MGKLRKPIGRMWAKLTPQQREVVGIFWRRKPYDELGAYILCRRFQLDNHIREVEDELTRMEQEANKTDTS